jgi:hypothetical protein
MEIGLSMPWMDERAAFMCSRLHFFDDRPMFFDDWQRNDGPTRTGGHIRALTPGIWGFDTPSYVVFHPRNNISNNWYFASLAIIILPY